MKLTSKSKNRSGAYSWTEKEIDAAGEYTGKFQIRLDKETAAPVKVNWWIVESE